MTFNFAARGPSFLVYTAPYITETISNYYKVKG